MNNRVEMTIGGRVISPSQELVNNFRVVDPATLDQAELKKMHDLIFENENGVERCILEFNSGPELSGNEYVSRKYPDDIDNLIEMKYSTEEKIYTHSEICSQEENRLADLEKDSIESADISRKMFDNADDMFGRNAIPVWAWEDGDGPELVKAMKKFEKRARKASIKKFGKNPDPHSMLSENGMKIYYQVCASRANDDRPTWKERYDSQDLSKKIKSKYLFVEETCAAQPEIELIKNHVYGAEISGTENVSYLDDNGYSVEISKSKTINYLRWEGDHFSSAQIYDSPEIKNMILNLKKEDVVLRFDMGELYLMDQNGNISTNHDRDAREKQYQEQEAKKAGIVF